MVARVAHPRVDLSVELTHIEDDDFLDLHTRGEVLASLSRSPVDRTTPSTVKRALTVALVCCSAAATCVSRRHAYLHTHTCEYLSLYIMLYIFTFEPQTVFHCYVKARRAVLRNTVLLSTRSQRPKASIATYSGATKPVRTRSGSKKQPRILCSTQHDSLSLEMPLSLVTKRVDWMLWVRACLVQAM